MGTVRSFTCDAILNEVREKLIARFGFEPSRAEEALKLVRGCSTAVAVRGRVKGICRDPDDDVILDCGVEARADVIVTGDKDLLVLHPFQWREDAQVPLSLDVLTPAELLKRIAIPS